MKFSALVSSLLSVFITGCSTVILDSPPEPGTLPYKQVVYVKNDGRCEQDEVMMVTGGNNSKNIPRLYECVESP
ncbi:hypothetical protein N9850_09925 [Granulosicoccus sp.]|nr:hypothetical protein [Granulosicoccus sp.]MDB4224076.1 hypothetical protein [Granulosicoccus sp.]